MGLEGTSFAEVVVVMRASTQQQHAEVLAAAREIIRVDYRTDLTVDDLARRLSVSRRSLQRSFALQRSSIREEIWKVRMTAACVGLVRTNDTVREIAHRVGYRQPEQFAKAFRRFRGVTPMEYRAGVSS